MNDRAIGALLVAASAVLWSSAGLFVRAVDLDAWTTLGWRSVFGTIALAALAALARKPAFARPPPRITLLAAALSGVSMVGYIFALKATSVANVLSIYATSPFIASGLSFLVLKEVPTRRLMLAAALAFCGVLIVTGSATDPGDIAGDALSFLMTASFSLLLVLARRDTTLDLPLVNALGAAGCVVLCGPAMAAHGLPDARTLGLLALFGLTTTAFAYTLYLTGVRFIPAGEAGIISQIDLVLGPLWVWLLFAERPAPAVLAGGGLILAGVLWSLWGDHRARTPERT